MVEDPVTGLFEPAFNTEFSAWLFDVTPEQLRTAYAVHGTIPPEIASKGKAKRLRLGTDDVGDAIEAYMRGEA
jgi:hypothetical protein